MTKMRMLAALAALLLAGPAPAQQPASNAERLAELMLIEPMVEQLFDGMVEPMGSMFEAQFPGRGNEVAAIFLEEYEAILAPHLPRIEREMTDLMTRLFTEDEIAEILDFYETPVGQKALEVMPAMMVETMEMMEPVMHDLTTVALPRAMERAGVLQGAGGGAAPAPAK